MPASLSDRLRSALPAQPTRADWVFALRTSAAGLVALSIAFALRLEQPQWAMMTVFIVSQPVAGMVLAKGMFRLVGTVVGALVAVGITLAAGPSSWLFILLLAGWIAACTFVSSTLRNPESYGAALAGYTAAIIGLPAFGNVHLLFDLATARCVEIVLGILCAGLASRFVLPQLARHALFDRLSDSVTDLARFTGAAIEGQDRRRLAAMHRTLIVDAQALAAMRAYARLEAPGLVTHGRQSRHTIGHLFSSISAVRTLLSHASAPDSAWRPLLGRLKALLDEVVAAHAATAEARGWLRRLDVLSQEARALLAAPLPAGEDRVGAAARLTLLIEFLATFKTLLEGLIALGIRTPDMRRDRPAATLMIHRDWAGARANAIRAGVATAIATAYWMATRWVDVEGVAIIVAVISSLFSSMPNPVRSTWGFFRGTLYAVPVGFVIGQLLLPALPGLGWFALLILPALVPAGLLMAQPPFTGVATAFSINLLLFINPRAQGAAASPLAFLNGAGALLAGILLAIGVFHVVLPQRPRQVAGRLMAAMRADLLRLCLHQRVPKPSAFESLAYDRVNQLLVPLERMGEEGKGLLDASIAAVTLGLELLRLRRTAQAGDLDAGTRTLIGQALTETARLLALRPREEKPVRALAALLREEAATMAARDATIAALTAAASLRLIAAVMEDHPVLFVRRDGDAE